MRIALVHPYPWPQVRRGAERYLDDLAHYLAAVGHEVTVVCGATGRPPGDERQGPLRTVVRPQLAPRALGRFGVSEVETFGVRALAPLLRSRADVVHAFTPSAALAGRLAGKPTLYTVLGHPVREQLPVPSAVRWLLRAALRAATATAVLSRASQAALADVLGHPSVVLPPGVRLERFPPNLSPRTGPPRLLLSASLADARKRPDLAVAALAGVRERHPGARLAVSGEGDPAVLAGGGAPGDGAGSGVVNGGSNGGADGVDVLGVGQPEEVPGRYRSATLTMLPAEHEAFGLALVESLASGTPVVCTPAGGMPEIVRDDVGRVARSADVTSLVAAACAVIELAADPATPRACAQRARRWGWREAVGPAHEHVYEHLASGRRGLPDTGSW